MPPKPESKTASRAPSGSKTTGKDKGKPTGKEKAATPAEPASDPAVLLQLRTSLRQIRQQCEQETQGINEAQMHKAKLEKFWAIEKQSRDDLKQQLMDRLKERADLEEKQTYEIKIYKEKVKHLLFEQQNETTEAHYEEQAQSQLQYGRESSVQHDANTTLRQIKVRRKELFTAHQELMSNIKLQQEQALMAMRQDFERKAEEQLQFFRKRQKQIRREFHERRKMDIKKIETRKDLHISKLMAKHQQAFEDIKTYYRDITHNNLDLIKSLKDEVGEMKKREQTDEKAVSDIHQLNAKLSQPLQKNLTLLEDLKKDLQSYELEQQELSRVKDRIGVLEYQIKSQTWEQEILEQKLELLTEERNELEENLQSTIYDAQQKAGFKNLLLERKLAALTDDLEKTEVALAEVLSSANLKPELIGNVRTTLQDLMKAKNQTINALEQQIFTLKMQYHDMVSNFEDILARHELPVENLGFSIQLIDE